MPRVILHVMPSVIPHVMPPVITCRMARGITLSQQRQQRSCTCLPLPLCSESVSAWPRMRTAWVHCTAHLRMQASSPSHVLQPRARSARARPAQAGPRKARGPGGPQVVAMFPGPRPLIRAAAQRSPATARGVAAAAVCCTPLHPHAQWYRHPPVPRTRDELCKTH